MYQMTNGDYIRSLSDEELAHALTLWIINHKKLVVDDRYLENFILYYLKQKYII